LARVIHEADFFATQHDYLRSTDRAASERA
jgi:hypothetical protein